MKKKIENKKPDWRKYLLYTLSAAMLTAPLFVPGMVRAAEPESEYEKEGGQDKEESKRPVSWEFKDGVLTVSGEGEMPDYSGTEEVPWIAVRDSVRKIVIEEGITSIGKQSFSNFENFVFERTALTSFEIPEKTTKVSALTFLGTPVGEYTVQSTTYGTFSGSFCGSGRPCREYGWYF